jgi:hypothetical protein
MDGVENGLVWGWACDRNSPLTSIRVSIYLGSTYSTKGPNHHIYVTADVSSEQGVTDACLGGASHRFTYTLKEEDLTHISNGDGKVYAYGFGVNSHGGVGENSLLSGSGALVDPTPAPQTQPSQPVDITPAPQTQPSQPWTPSPVEYTFKFTTGTISNSQSGGKFKASLGNDACAVEFTPAGRGLSIEIEMSCPGGTPPSPLKVEALTADGWFLETVEYSDGLGSSWESFGPSKVWVDAAPYNAVTGTYPCTNVLPCDMREFSQGSGALVDPTPAPQTQPSQPYLGGDDPPIGWLDGVENGLVWGWTCDRNSPLTSIRVSIYLGSTYSPEGPNHHVNVNADVSSEQGVTDACLGGTSHRFTYTLKEEDLTHISNGDGKVYAYGLGVNSHGGVGTNAALSGSGALVDPTPAPQTQPTPSPMTPKPTFDPLIPCQRFKVILIPVRNREGITWHLKNQDNVIVASGGPYPNVITAQIIAERNVCGESFSFTIFDNKDFGQTNYKLYLMHGGEFKLRAESDWEIDFCYLRVPKCNFGSSTETDIVPFGQIQDGGSCLSFEKDDCLNSSTYYGCGVEEVGMNRRALSGVDPNFVWAPTPICCDGVVVNIVGGHEFYCKVPEGSRCVAGTMCPSGLDCTINYLSGEDCNGCVYSIPERPVTTGEVGRCR